MFYYLFGVINLKLSLNMFYKFKKPYEIYKEFMCLKLEFFIMDALVSH